MSVVRFLRVAGAVAVLVAGPTALRAQARQELPARLQSATREAIERLADSLARESLPAASLYDKAAEGVLKGADDARILTAVRGLAQRLRDVRALLGPTSAAAELTAGASALHAGANAQSIKRLADARERDVAANRSLSVPLTVLANLISDGVPAPIATESLTALIGRGARDEELTAFRLGVARDIEGGKSPGDATSRGTERLLRTIDTRMKQP